MGIDLAKGSKITKGELRRLVWEEPIVTLAKRFEVSPNGLAKICDRLDIDRPPKGYWSNPAAHPRPVDAAADPDSDELVEIGGARHGARRRQTRLSLDERKQQIMDRAKELILEEGVHGVSLRGIARQIGISEAQAYNCFDSRTSLLVELTMRELDAFEAQRADTVRRGSDRLSKVILSTLLYLQVAAERGEVTTHLLSLYDVRKEVTRRRRSRRSLLRQRQIQQLVEDRSVPEDRAQAEVALLGHLTLRAGDLVSLGKLSIVEAQQLIMPAIVRTAASSRRGG
ncbi:hypothetical protein HAD_00900 [Hyphomonas adhaerens MHS-3]|uniref:HTH tetR-type domain-containing protein n=1 Tax=Hyphomonas adhaerens MHS-3 TaxID=1280949 RepID=A0A069E2T0_9PROT|nr:TetR/AcrR family transcriptional regulator [Hyphomonas adhaerens]KCZ84193.1 hypothetical protein HAD_00900 [Hyphomonas adhaerens MHS-3]